MPFYFSLITVYFSVEYSAPRGNNWQPPILKIFGWTISAALGLALPTIICMLLTNVAFGIMNRVSPSFNIFALGFPMTMLVGLFSMLLSASNIPSKYNDFVVQTLDWLTYYNQGAP